MLIIDPLCAMKKLKKTIFLSLNHNIITTIITPKSNDLIATTVTSEKSFEIKAYAPISNKVFSLKELNSVPTQSKKNQS